jgi:hypothetical protein
MPAPLTKHHAFDHFISTQYPKTYMDHDFMYPAVDLRWNEELDETERAEVQALIDTYVEPAYYLNFHHVENHCLNTTVNSSGSPALLQTFIVSPDIPAVDGKGQVDSYLGDLKTIAEFLLDDTSVLTNWDDSPVSVVVKVHCLTKGVDIATHTTDITSILTNWKNNPASSYTAFESIQMYGFYGTLPDYDCIWQLYAHVTLPGVGVKFNSLQKIYYQVE